VPKPSKVLMNATLNMVAGDTGDVLAETRTIAGITGGWRADAIQLGALKGDRDLPLPALATASTGDKNYLAIGLNNASTAYNGVLGFSSGVTPYPVIKVGIGTLALGGVNTISGDVELQAGVLSLVNPLALQKATLAMWKAPEQASPPVVPGGTNVTGAASYTGTLEPNGQDFLLGGLRGDRNLVVPVPGSGSPVMMAVGNNNASTSYSGVISGVGTFAKVGTGTLTLNGNAPQAYVGPTAVVGGTLLLDFASLSPATNLVPATGLLLAGGALQLKPAASGTTSQSFSDTAVELGDSAVKTVAGAANSVNLAAITRQLGGVVDFSPGTGGQVTTTSSNVNSILGGWATWDGGAGWAAVSGGTIGPLATYSSTYGDTANVDVPPGTSTVGGATANSLRVNGSSDTTLNLNANSTLTLKSGGILITPSAVTTVNTTIGSLATQSTLQPDAGKDLVLIQDNSGTLTINSVVTDDQSGNAGVTKSGPGTLVLANPGNYFKGPLRINGGKVNVAAANLSYPIVFGGSSTGVLQVLGRTFVVPSLSSELSVPNSGTVENGLAGTPGTLVVSNLSDCTFTGTLRDGGSKPLSVQKSNSGMLTLAGTGSFTGGVAINDGVLRLASATALDTGTTTPNVLTFGGGISPTLRLAGNSVSVLGLAGDTAFNAWIENGAAAPATLTVVKDSGTDTFAGTLQDGAGGGKLGLTKIGAGTLVLAGANSATGAMTVKGGLLQGSTASLTGPLSLVGGSVTFDQAMDDKYSHPITGYTPSTEANGRLTAGAFTKTNLGNLTLNAASSFKGGALIAEGTVTLTNSTALGTGKVDLKGTAGLVVDTGLGRGLDGFYYNGWSNDRTRYDTLAAMLPYFAGKTPAATYNSLQYPNSPNFDFPGNAQFPPNFNGTNGIVFDAYWHGYINIPTDGSYIFATASDDGSMMWIDGTNVVYNNYLQGTTKRTGNPINLTAGYHEIYMQYDDAGGGGESLTAYITMPGQAEVPLPQSMLFRQVATNLTLSSLVGDDASTIHVTRGNSIVVGSDNASTTYPGVISGEGGLTKVGLGTLTLSGTNTFSGDARPSTGTLKLGSPLALQGATLAWLSTDSGTLDYNNASFTLGGIRGDRNFEHKSTLPAITLTLAGSLSTNYTGVLSGPLSLSKTGDGTQALSGLNTYTGKTTISGGVLSANTLADAGVPSSLGSPTGANAVIDLGPGALQYTGGPAGTNRAIRLTGDGTIINNAAGGPLTLNGAISGSSGLTLDGTGTLVLPVLNTYTGKTAIKGGVVSVHTLTDAGAPSSLGNPPAGDPIADIDLGPGTLRYTGGATSTNRTINLTGAGTIENNATGNSTLALTGGLSGTGTLTLRGTGNGTLSGPVNPTGPISLTKAGAGTWSIAGAMAVTALNATAGTLNLDGAWTVATATLAGATVNAATNPLIVTDNATLAQGVKCSAMPGTSFELRGNDLANDVNRTLMINNGTVTLASSIALPNTHVRAEGISTLDMANSAYPVLGDLLPGNGASLAVENAAELSVNNLQNASGAGSAAITTSGLLPLTVRGKVEPAGQIALSGMDLVLGPGATAAFNLTALPTGTYEQVDLGSNGLDLTTAGNLTVLFPAGPDAIGSGVYHLFVNIYPGYIAGTFPNTTFADSDPPTKGAPPGYRWVDQDPDTDGFQWIGYTRTYQERYAVDVELASLGTHTEGAWTNATGDGKWSTDGNWTPAKPSASGDVAKLDRLAGSPDGGDVSVDVATTVGSIMLNSTNGTPAKNFNVVGSALTLDNTNYGNARITVSQGAQTLRVPLALASNLTISAAAGTTLTLTNDLSESVAGRTITLDGLGTVVLSGTNHVTGTVKVSKGTLDITSGLAAHPGNDLVIEGGGQLVFAVDLILGAGSSAAARHVPAVEVSPVPEPGTLALAAVGALAIVGMWLRRRK
jgi:autotransporter-associated beta strand protein